MGLYIHQIKVGGFDENFAYLVSDTETKQAFVVDPSGDLDTILAAADESALTICGVLITHTHADHLDQLAELLRVYAVPVYVHEFGSEAIVSPGEIVPLRDRGTIPLSTSVIEVMHTPGHIDDAVCYFIPAEAADNGVPKVLTGDTLFVEGCGRTSEARVKDLYESLQELKLLPDQTEVYPGHDYGSRPHSTIKYEKEHNRYLLAENFMKFKSLRLG